MKPSILYLFLTFLRIGATSWGGFMALISMIQKKVVEKDELMDNRTIMEGISLASVLPGPMAVNVVSFVGYRLGGIKGAFISIFAVLLPSFVLMLVLSHFYLQYGDIPALSHFFSGVLPAVAAVITSVAASMSEKTIKDSPQIAIALVAAIIVTISRSYLTTLGVLAVSGLFGYFYYFKNETEQRIVAASDEAPGKMPKVKFIELTLFALFLALIFWIVVLFNKNGEGIVSLHKTISITFAGMSLSQFGGGYVIIPTMQKIIVDGMKWLSNQEFADAIAMGQITPGPIFISATFIGYKLAGFWGAVNATISIFFPTALLTIICTRFFGHISKSAVVVAVFKAVRPSIIGMIASIAFTMMINHGITTFSAVVFASCLFLVMRVKVDPVYVIPAAGIAGLLIL